MGEFKDFIQKRFGYTDLDITSSAASTEVTNPKATEETPISDTAANQHFMNRFCRVN